MYIYNRNRNLLGSVRERSSSSLSSSESFSQSREGERESEVSLNGVFLHAPPGAGRRLQRVKRCCSALRKLRLACQLGALSIIGRPQRRAHRGPGTSKCSRRGDWNSPYQLSRPSPFRWLHRRRSRPRFSQAKPMSGRSRGCRHLVCCWTATCLPSLSSTCSSCSGTKP